MQTESSRSRFPTQICADAASHFGSGSGFGFGFSFCALPGWQSENDFSRKLACPEQFTLLLQGKQEVESIYKQELQTNSYIKLNGSGPTPNISTAKVSSSV